MSNSTVDIIIAMIEKRRDMVMQTNQITKDLGGQYEWINGIYQDIIEMIKQAPL